MTPCPERRTAIAIILIGTLLATIGGAVAASASTIEYSASPPQSDRSEWLANQTPTSYSNLSPSGQKTMQKLLAGETVDDTSALETNETRAVTAVEQNGTTYLITRDVTLQNPHLYHSGLALVVVGITSAIYGVFQYRIAKSKDRLQKLGEGLNP